MTTSSGPRPKPAAKVPEVAGLHVTAGTRLLGVIGHPINHSLSPKMHNAAFAGAGGDAPYAYVAMDVRPEHLAGAVRGLVSLGFAGFNVTMPHKETILPLLNEVEEAARLSGAVNTVAIEDGRLRGLNTDGPGFLRACEEAGVGLAGEKVLVLGAGGAAAAVAVAALGAGAEALMLANRTPARAAALAGRLRELSSGRDVRVYPLAQARSAAEEAGVIVNTTYLGMKDVDPLPVPVEVLGPERSVCDVVYRPDGDTELVRRARGRGVRVATGARMLLYQGVEAQRVWTGREPDVGAMSDALG